MKAPDGIRTRYPATYQVGIQPDELQVPAFVFGADGVLSTPLSWLGTCNITPSPHLILGTPTLVVATPSVVRLLGVATILSHTNPQKLGARDGTRTRKAYASAWKAELLPLETLSQNWSARWDSNPRFSHRQCDEDGLSSTCR